MNIEVRLNRLYRESTKRAIYRFLRLSGLTGILIHFFNFLNAQAPDWIWAKSIGEIEFINNSRCITTDPETNDVYTTGAFAGIVDFNPGSGYFTLSSVGKKDIFISKLNSIGGFVWAFSLGAPGATIEGYSIISDTTGSGSIFVTGDYDGTVDFDPGSGVFNLTSTGGSDVFIANYTVTGNLIWAKSFGGNGDEMCFSIAIDQSRNGGIYAIGKFSGTVDFNPGSGVYNLSATGGDDIFISKLDDTGAFLWAKKFGGSLNDIGYAITISKTGEIYCTGKYEGIADFDPGPGIFNLTSMGSADLFIAKLNASGGFLWAKGIGGAGTETSYAIAVDTFENGGVYTTGQFSGLVDFNPGPGIFNLTAAGGLAASVYSKTMVSDTAGEGAIYISGWFQGTVDFDPGPGIFNLSGNNTSFISKYDSIGNFRWAYVLAVDINSMALNDGQEEGVFTTGSFSGTVDFNPAPGVFNVTSIGYQDGYISKLNGDGELEWVKIMAGAGSNTTGINVSVDTFNDHSIYIGGNFTGTVDFDPGTGIFNLNAIGETDNFICKFDSLGNFAWAKRNGGNLWEELVAMTMGPNQEIHFTGNFRSPTLQFDSTTLYNSDGTGLYYDIFIGKLDHCASLVTNTFDNGSGSLRDVISCVSEGATITFSLPLLSQINLTSGEIVIDKNITLSGPGISNLTLSGDNTSRIFHLLPGKNMCLKNLSLKNTTSLLNGGAIYSQGNMTFENILFQNNFQAGIPRALTAAPGTVLNIVGSVNFKL